MGLSGRGTVIAIEALFSAFSESLVLLVADVADVADVDDAVALVVVEVVLFEGLIDEPRVGKWLDIVSEVLVDLGRSSDLPSLPPIVVVVVLAVSAAVRLL